MKRSLSIFVLLVFSAFLAVSQFEATPPVCAEPIATGEIRNAAFDTKPPEPVEGQSADKPTARSLDCVGCHGPGRTLPYLGPDRFHAEAHGAYDRGFHARSIQNGRRAANCLDCHSSNGDMTTMLPARDPKSTVNRANIAKTCGSCHSQKAAMEGTGISNRPFLSYQESVHAHAIVNGNTKAAVCTDCHSSHDIRPASDGGSPIFKANLAKTCGQCHSDIAGEYNRSVHGEAVARGVSRSPVCTDCHGIHNIKPHLDPATSATSQALATGSCVGCHDGVALTQEFGVASGRVTSYQDSYHGLASKLGSTVAANCASCHGVHNILPSTNPRSMINRSNLVTTCGQCHPGAGENFILGQIHLNVPASSGGSAPSEDIAVVMTGWVRRVYLWLIGVVIGGMLIHNFFVWRKKALAKRLATIRSVVRMSRAQRIQHLVMLVSFTALVLTGFALKYPDSWLAALLGSSEPFRRISHRVAGVLLIAVGIFHLWYVGSTTEGRKALWDMLPRRKDVADFIQAMRYYVLGNSTKPKFARFNYAEKAEYWAVVWGTIIMGLTGVMVWFKVEVFGFLPRWIIEVALAIHFYEAILATLAIVVWHLYNVIFDPDVYPLNWALVDGRVSEDYYKEEHELDYEQMKLNELAQASEDQPAETGETHAADMAASHRDRSTRSSIKDEN